MGRVESQVHKEGLVTTACTVAEEGQRVLGHDLAPVPPPGPVAAEARIRGRPRELVVGAAAEVAGERGFVGFGHLGVGACGAALDPRIARHPGTYVARCRENRLRVSRDVPLAGEVGPVAGGGHALGPQRGGRSAIRPGLVQAVALPERAPRIHHTAGGHTDRRLPATHIVGAREGRAAGHEPVEVGREDVCVAERPHGVVGHVVGEDEEDVGAGRLHRSLITPTTVGNEGHYGESETHAGNVAAGVRFPGL